MHWFVSTPPISTVSARRPRRTTSRFVLKKALRRIFSMIQSSGATSKSSWISYPHVPRRRPPSRRNGRSCMNGPPSSVPRVPCRVQITGTCATRLAATSRCVGSITRRMCEMSMPLCAYQPSGCRKSRWSSITTSAVWPGTSSQRTGSYGVVTRAAAGSADRRSVAAPRPPDAARRGCRRSAASPGSACSIGRYASAMLCSTTWP